MGGCAREALSDGLQCCSGQVSFHTKLPYVNNAPLPMFTTKVPGMGAASIHSPARFWTCSPG